MVEYLTHYYIGSVPFRSLSALTEAESLKIMEGLANDTDILSRFKEPIHYMNNRKRIEKWLKDEFITKGGQPKDEYPIYAILGNSSWIEQFSSTVGIKKILVPLSLFEETDISFTYPDSMVSYTYAYDKPQINYQHEYHGKLFTLTEITAIVMQQGLPEKDWKFTMPDNTGSYIEAQMWNLKPLLTLWESMI